MAEKQQYSLLCPNCRKLIGSDERVCPYCGSSSPASPWKRGITKFLSPATADIVSLITYTNVFMYVLSMLFSQAQISLSANPLNFLSPSSQAMLLLGATGTIPIDQFHRWWTLLSANYLHGGILHIFFNMMILRQLGPAVLREYGVSRMIIIYTAGGLIGYVVSYMAGVRFTIGASAAVCGLIGALLYYGKSRGGSYGQALYKEIFGWVVTLGIFGLIVPGINNWGHGGGIAGGIAVAWLLGYVEKKKENILHKTAAGICIIATLLILIYAIFTAILIRLAG